jgi:dTDP-4-dehydrorhamnose reductase
MKVLVLGGGQVATAVVETAAPDYEIIAYPRAKLDIADGAAVTEALGTIKPNWIINAAAYTAVDRAEDEPSLAQAVNDTAVAWLAQGALRHGGRLLHISTDFVFDGKSNRAYRPDDATNPLSVYGSTKLAGERHVLASASGIVLRTSWVYASSGKNFVLTMLKLMREREQVSVVADQIGSPTWADSLAAAIWGLVGVNSAGGIYHWSDLGVASWYDFAVAIQDEALQRGLLTRPAAILPTATAAYPTKATRPGFSLLDSSATRAALATPARHWRHNLRTMLDEIRTA